MGPLEGIRVLELSQAQQGPVAGLVLGYLGAGVIKIEYPGGERARGAARLPDQKQGRSPYFEGFNLNKKGITLDLKKDKGKEIFYKLIEKADVFVTNFRRRAMERLGIDYATVRAYNSKLIYAMASAWGPDGTERDEPGYDHAAQAATGLMYKWGVSSGEEPLYWNIGLADQIGGLLTAQAVVAALFHRERYGVGQEVNASLFGGIIFTQSLLLNNWLVLGRTHSRTYRTHANQPNPLYNNYKCQDGEWIWLGGGAFERYWPGVCEVLGIEKEIATDPRWQDPNTREENSPELITILDKIFLKKPCAEWVAKLREKGTICAAIRDHSQLVLADPQQALANRYFTEFDHPVWGPTKIVGLPMKFSETPWTISRAAPELGQHTEEVLIELLGYNREEIAKLTEESVI